MKTRLPRTLFVALMAAVSTVCAAEYNFTPQAILNGSETAETVKSTLEMQQAVPTLDGRTAVVIDAKDSMMIDQNIAMTTPLVVREGTVTIGNTEGDSSSADDNVQFSIGNTGSSHGSRLTVGGKDAKLILDNANFSTTKSGNGNNSVSVGGQDGDGTLIVTGGSSMFIQQALFAGYASLPTVDNWTGSHVTGTVVSETDSTYYRNVDPETKFADTTIQTDENGGVTRYSTATIRIEDGSQVEAGGGLYFGNGTITVTGEGSALKVGTNTDGNIVCLADYGNSKLVVEDGASFYSGKSFTSGYAEGSNTTVEVTNASFEVDNTLTIGVDGVKSEASYNFNEGATVKVKNLVMGTTEGVAKVNIAEKAKYTGETMQIGANGTLTNSGSTTVTNLEMTGTAAGEGSSQSTATIINNGGTFKVSKDAQIENAVIDSNAGTVRFDGKATVKNSTITAVEGNVDFNNGANLQGGNVFTTNGTVEKLYFGGSSTAEGNNTFNGQIKMNNLVVKSGTQKFENSTNEASMSFSGIGFADDADASAAINVSSSNGNVVFKNNCAISSVEANNSAISIYNTLLVKDSITLNGGSSVSFYNETKAIELFENRRIYQGEDGRYAIKYNTAPREYEIWVLTDDGSAVAEKITENTAAVWEVNWGANDHIPVKIVTSVSEAKLVFEIDSIYELIDQPAVMLIAADSNGNLMLNVAEDVDLSKANVELLFTEQALKELEALDEQAVTLNLDKVTDLEGVQLSFAVAESYGKTAEEVFGTTSVETGTFGTGVNSITITKPVPEPTTATLSLLALMGLAARRRRK